MKTRTKIVIGIAVCGVAVGKWFKPGDVRSSLSHYEATVNWIFTEGAPWNSSSGSKLGLRVARRIFSR
jgi:hypothetical protein